MLYTFNVKNSNDKKINKIYKKITRIQFLEQHKGIITILTTGIIYIFINLTKNVFPIFKGHGFSQFLFSIFFSLFLISLIEFLFNEKRTYKKMSDALDCSIFVKNIDLKLLDTNEDINNIEIPTLDIKYDTKHSNGNIAIMVKIQDNKYKIISFLDNSEKGKNKRTIIPSLKLKEAFLELNDTENLVFLNICQIKTNKKVGEYVSEDEMDVRSLITEALFVERYEDA